MSKEIVKLAFDTNAVIAYLGEDPRAIAWVAFATESYFPVVVKGELEYGAIHGSRAEENSLRLERFFAKWAVLDITRNTTHYYATTREALTLRGRMIPESDLWIAAVCLEEGLPLVTEDAHFDAVPGLKRYNWTEPPPQQKRKKRK